MSALAHWWSKGAKNLGKGAAEETAKIMNDLTRVRELASNASKYMNEVLQTGNSKLGRAVQSLNSSMKHNEAELQRILRSINQKESLAPDKQIEGVQNVLSGLKEQRAVLSETLAQQKRQLAALSDMMQKSITPGQEKAALDVFTQNSDLASITGVLEWQQNLNEAFRVNRQVINSASRHLGNDTKFLQEYLSMKRNPEAARKLEMWVANPKNSQKLQSLMNKDRIADIVGRGKMTARERLVGLTPLEQATSLGIGAAALGGAAKALDVFDWFDSNDPGQLFDDSSGLRADLNALETVGYGKTLVAKVDMSLGRISALTAGANAGLGQDPTKAATKFTQDFTKELDTLERYMGQWQAVVDSSNDPDKAEAIGEKIQNLIKNGAEGLKELGGRVGFSGGSGMAGSRMGDSNLTKIQSLLSNQLGINVAPTGELDQMTVNGLRSLEQKFNAQAQTNEFTGAFVLPEVNYVISYGDLMEAFNRIRKY